MNNRLKIIALLLAAVVLLLAITYAIGVVVTGRQLAAAYAALEADQRPMTAVDVIPTEVPSEDNAALVFKAVILQLSAEPGEDGNVFDQATELASKVIKDSASEAERMAFETLIQSEPFTQALDDLSRGASKPGYWHDRDYSQGAGILLPECQENRQLSRLLAAAAITAARGGDGDAAWALLETGLRLADHGANEPFLISQLVRIAQLTTTTSAMQKVSDYVLPTASQAAEIDTLLASFDDDRGALALAIDGERLLLGEWAFNLPGEKFSELGEGLSLYATLKPLFQLDHAAYLRIMHVLALECEAPTFRTLASDELIEEIPKTCVLTRMLVPALNAAFLQYSAMIAHSRLARVGLQALRHHADTGAYPETLANLGDLGTLQDPFTNGAFTYAVENGGFICYSLGQNGKDDKGLRDYKEGDVVWSTGLPWKMNE
jgi:hypothetical protein